MHAELTTKVHLEATHVEKVSGHREKLGVKRILRRRLAKGVKQAWESQVEKQKPKEGHSEKREGGKQMGANTLRGGSAVPLAGPLAALL